MKSALLRTREKIRRQREENIRLRLQLRSTDQQLSNAQSEVVRLQNRLARVTSSTIDRDPMSQHVNFCVRIDQRNLERNRDAAIDEAMRQLASQMRNQGI
jgi:hypothetical protein